MNWWGERESDSLIKWVWENGRRGRKRICLQRRWRRYLNSEIQWKRSIWVTGQVLFAWPWALPDICQCCPLLCFHNHPASLRPPLISPDKGMEPFSLSHQLLRLSTIRPIGLKLLYCAAVNWPKQILETQDQCSLFYVTPTEEDICWRPVRATCVIVKSKNI